MRLEELFHAHLDLLDGQLAEALERAARKGLGAEGVVFHSGTERTYHADDHLIPFHTVPHFARWVPLPGPDHLLIARPGERPRLIRTAPRDFWYEAPLPLPEHCREAFDLIEVASRAEAVAAAEGCADLAYLGDDPGLAARLGVGPERVEPESLLAPLDWSRAVKTPYEVACLREAAALAARGHRGARERFEAGGSEKEIHDAYLAAAGITELECPYGSIVALDEKAAILHYQNKRAGGGGRLLLIDAGAAAWGYASDVTRTYLAPAERQGPLAAILDGMDALERELVAGVRPGRPYLEIHLEAHERIAGLLAESGLVSCSGEEALARGITRTFFPHGVGHHLGLQVHDVGGRQAAPEGGTTPPPEGHEFLRNTRRLEPGHYVTIEPGIYFIEMLLGPLRASEEGRVVNWDLVESLTPYGGIRIEDDVLVTEDGGEDLTRPLIPGHGEDRGRGA
jgi:Xaa-Pro dipeptidase